MKYIKYTLVLFALVLNIQCFSQIFPGEGLAPMVTCNFETDCTMVSLDTNLQGNIWRIGVPAKPSFSPAYSIPNAMVTDLNNNYPQGTDSWFDIYLDIMGGGYWNPVIAFNHKFETDSLADGGFIEISYNKGNTWKNILFDTSNVFMSFDYGTPNRENFYTASDTIAGGIPAFTGTSDGWQLSRIQWIWFVPVKDALDFPTDTVILRFHFISDSIETGKAGWIIDDLVIYNTLMSDIPEWAASGNNIKIYPNPASDEIRFGYRGVDDTNEIWIYDALGRCVLYDKNATDVIIVSQIPRGVYAIVMKNKDNGFYHGIFVKE